VGGGVGDDGETAALLGADMYSLLMSLWLLLVLFVFALLLLLFMLLLLLLTSEPADEAGDGCGVSDKYWIFLIVVAVAAVVASFLPLSEPWADVVAAAAAAVATNDDEDDADAFWASCSFSCCCFVASNIADLLMRLLLRLPCLSRRLSCRTRTVLGRSSRRIVAKSIVLTLLLPPPPPSCDDDAPPCLLLLPLTLPLLVVVRFSFNDINDVDVLLLLLLLLLLFVSLLTVDSFTFVVDFVVAFFIQFCTQFSHSSHMFSMFSSRLCVIPLPPVKWCWCWCWCWLLGLDLFTRKSSTDDNDASSTMTLSMWFSMGKWSAPALRSWLL
jgi:hypothetical protein